MRPFPIVLSLSLAVCPLSAAVRGARPLHAMRQAAAPAAVPRGVRAELLRDLDEVQKKYLSLAGAVPADRYEWRPGKGVRSISEVYMHIAGANYTLVSFVGDRPPLDPRSFERITEKPRVIEEMRRSFDNLREAILTTTDADLDKTIRMFGNERTERAAFMMAINHLHEHLGQSIAYARMNGIVPPWSAE